jgi:hypothetical protein
VRELAILKKEKKIKGFDQMDALFPPFSFHTLLVSIVVLVYFRLLHMKKS